MAASPNPNHDPNSNPKWEVNTATGQNYHCLTFSLKFPDAQLDDVFYLAYGVPYTTQDLKRDLLSLDKSPYVERGILCKSP